MKDSDARGCELGGPHRGNSLSFTNSVGKEALAERRFGGAIPDI